jgi:hypothetical protein
MPPPFVACDRCGAWLSGEPNVALGGLAYCPGPCAPWARVPSPFLGLDELAARALARLEAERLPAARAEAILAWVRREAPRWPGPRPWVTWAHAGRAQALLEALLAWEPYRGPPRRFTGGMVWPDRPPRPARAEPPSPERCAGVGPETTFERAQPAEALAERGA